MFNINQKYMGITLIGIAIATIILLGLVKSDLDKRDAVLCEVTHITPSFNIKECPAHTSNTNWFLIIAFGLTSIALAVGLYIYFIKESVQLTHNHSFKHIDVTKLDEIEKQVYHIMKESDGSVYQSDIVKQLGFSKVKTTRLLDKMEQKGILERKRRGMTNIIVLR